MGIVFLTGLMAIKSFLGVNGIQFHHEYVLSSLVNGMRARARLRDGVAVMLSQFVGKENKRIMELSGFGGGRTWTQETL